PVFIACLSFGGGLCWRLAEAGSDSTGAIQGIFVLGASVDRSFLEHVPVSRPHIYLGIGSKDTFARWRSAETFFKDLKTADPDYPIKLTVFDAGTHGTAIRLTDWVAVLNWMLIVGDIHGKAIAAPVAAGPPCPRPRPGPAGPGPASYCGRP